MQKFVCLVLKVDCRKDRTISSIIFSDREKHSKKPDEVRNKIVQLYGDVFKIELFARQTADGWDSWETKSKLSCSYPNHLY